MAARSNPQIAASVSIGRCSCPCGTVYVQLHDAEGEIYAIAPMPAEVAERFVATLAGTIDRTAGRSLAEIRCAGRA